MDTQRWLDEMECQLRISGVSATYQTRLLEELRDHIEDLSCEERMHAMSAEAVKSQYLDTRLGPPQEIAEAAKASIRQTQFALRHPIVTFVVLPIPVLVLMWVAYALLLIVSLNLFQSYKDVGWVVTAASGLIHGLAYVPAVALTLLIAWIASRSRARWGWWIAASVIVACVSGLMIVTFAMPTTPGTGRLAIGLGFPPDLSRWPQIAIPLVAAIGSFALIRRRRQRAASTPSVA